MRIKSWMAFMTNSQSARLIMLFPLALFLSASAIASKANAEPFKITAMKAMLFYEDKGTFSEDVSEEDKGPPYVPPKLWNTPLQHESGSTSVFVTVEVTGDAVLTPETKVEFVARYVPWMRESREIVVRRIVPIRVSIKMSGTDKYYAGFWLYDTGCHPAKLAARIIGQRSSIVKRVIKYGCGE